MSDPIFKKKFGIKTSIRYLKERVIEKGKKKQFEEAWKRAFKKLKPNLSESREMKFEAYFRRLKRDGDDLYYTKRIAIKYISKKVGYGAFAKVDIPPYSTLGHYTGIYRLDKQIDEDNDSTFTFNEFRLFSIDALNAGNWVRFMNHAGKGNINAIAWEYYTKEGPFIVFTSGPRGVKKNEQLLYSYGDEYWHDETFKSL